MEISQDRYETKIDLTNCDREAIHIPGSIQPQGFLFALDPKTFVITHISANTAKLFAVSVEQMIGRPFADFVHVDHIEWLHSQFLSGTLEKNNPFRLDLMVDGKTTAFQIISHIYNDKLIIELERHEQVNPGGFRGFYHDSRESISALRSTNSLEELYGAAVAEVRRITGFDRVLIYRFDTQWDGHVLAEVRKESVDSYLDLRFPASDIPRQARELYCLTRVRVIPTIHYAPAKIFADPNDSVPLDLSLAALRSVSPIHLEYLKNMGASASMSISLMQEGALWGLISCTHESGPLPVPFEARAVCDLIGEIMSSLLSVRINAEFQSRLARKSLIQSQLLETMTQGDDFVAGLLKSSASFMELVAADGAAVVMQGDIQTVGLCPDPNDIVTLVAWLMNQPNQTIYAFDCLPKILSGAGAFKDKACGLLAFPISRVQSTWVLWFRPEVIQTVKWGGDPRKPVEVKSGVKILHPRKSFETWKETVKLKSRPWLREEVDSGLKLRSAIIDVVIQKMEKISNLNKELARSNVDLDSFAYAASHDLKEPLRGIHNYAAILLRSTQDRLTEEEFSRLKTITRLTQRMEDLINSLLMFSQVGRADMFMRETDLNIELKVALESLKSRIDETNTEIQTTFDLPKVYCDRSQIVEVFTNLISNAIKYNDSPKRIVKVGWLNHVEQGPTIFVQDNGIGIEVEHQAAIFKIFKRLHGKDQYGGGTGTGLTITQKIIDRHGGRLWLDRAPGGGTIFYFSFGRKNEH